LKQEQRWSAGKLMNVTPFYTIRGEKKDPGTIKNGNGTLITYMADGKVDTNQTYVNGLLQGEYTAYFPSGAIKESGRYTQNQREGTWKQFHENGRLASEGKYIGGEMSGKWSYYNPRGRLISVINHDQEAE
ncbi:unnamed protein product, partial [Chrysoparadoxa australica]